AMSTYIGFGMMGALFLTGNPLNLLVYGLFPPEVQARMNWGNWFLAALPTHLVLFGLSMLFVVARYRPEHTESVPEATLALQRRVLGPLSRAEWSVLAVMGLLLAGFCTQSLHGIDPAWIAVAAVGVLFLTGTLDDVGFRSGVNVSFLVYVGVILGFGDVFNHVQLQQWLSQQSEGLAGMVRGSPLLFVVAVALVSMLLGIIFRPGPIAVLLALALYQTAASLGIDPWVVAVTAILATNLWLYPQQNVLYLTAYHGTGERAFSHAQARPLAVVYALAVLVAIAVSVPYWTWIGLIR
ncbi:MAG: anion permease, partial [Chloroflexota bacterium]|nr:anion permease [Chloroflexota bacterium]